jgi:hypothetical protein
MPKHTPLSLSIQREIKKHRLNFESDIDKSMGKLGFRNLLNRSGIRKQKGHAPIRVLLVLILLPRIKEGVRSLGTKEFYGRFLNARFVLFDSLETGTDTANLRRVFTKHALTVFNDTRAIPPVGKWHAVDIADHSVRLAIAQAQVAIDIDRDALPRGGAVATSLRTVGELLAAQQQVIPIASSERECLQTPNRKNRQSSCQRPFQRFAQT